MSKLHEKPVLHGRDHLPGHPDPIPGLEGLLGAVGDFETVVMGITDLYAYWRLGETGSPWLDTSGVGTATNLVQTGSGTALTPDVTGALATGDDGAVQFNYDGTSSGGGRYLQSTTFKHFGTFDNPDGEMTVAVWVKVQASALTRRGHIIGNSTVLGDNSMGGWGLHVMYPSRVVRFTRGQVTLATPEKYIETAGGVIADEWNFFVATYDGATSKLYANGNLVASAADTDGEAGVDADGIKVGYAITEYVSGSQKHSWLYGTVDEAALWTRALGADDIALLYAAGTDTGSSGGGSYDPATATQAWMPLVDSDGTCVLDSGDVLIPTLVTL